MKIYDNEQLSKKIKTRKIFSTIIRSFINIIVATLFIVCIMLLTQKIEKPNMTPSLFGYKAFITVSGSMEPTINIGDIVVTSNVKQEDINKGDIITFIEEQQRVTHRVTEIFEEDGKLKYQTKGDNNNSNDDELVDFEEIEGIYKFKIAKIGNIILKMRNLVTIGVIVIIIYIIYKIVQKKEDRKLARHQTRERFEKNNKNEK